MEKRSGRSARTTIAFRTPPTVRDRRVANEPTKNESAGELLADWRSASRDTVAARAAASVARLALAAAEAAEEAANEVEAAATSASQAVDRARAAAIRAREAAAQAAEAAQIALASAEGDKARAAGDVARAEAAETAARERFHEAENKGFPRK